MLVVRPCASEVNPAAPPKKRASPSVCPIWAECKKHSAPFCIPFKRGAGDALMQRCSVFLHDSPGSAKPAPPAVLSPRTTQAIASTVSAAEPPVIQTLRLRKGAEQACQHRAGKNTLGAAMKGCHIKCLVCRARACANRQGLYFPAQPEGREQTRPHLPTPTLGRRARRVGKARTWRAYPRCELQIPRC